MRCQLRTPERTLFDGEANMVVAHSPEGEFAVMAGHAPLIAALDTAPLRVKTTEGEKTFAILAGALQVSPSGVTILAQEALPAEAIDLSAVSKQREEIEHKLATSEDKDALRQELAWLAVREQLGKHHG